MVLQGVEPYMSSESIEKGARWSTHIGKELEEARFGLVILTKENLSSRWLHFEAGAVANWLGPVVSVVSGGLGCVVATAWVAAVTPALRHYAADRVRR